MPRRGTLPTLATFTVVSVDRGRRLRYREYLARRIAERLHRLAVEEVMCRHLPPRYLARVLAGDRPPPEAMAYVGNGGSLFRPKTVL